MLTLLLDCDDEGGEAFTLLFGFSNPANPPNVFATLKVRYFTMNTPKPRIKSKIPTTSSTHFPTPITFKGVSSCDLKPSAKASSSSALSSAQIRGKITFFVVSFWSARTFLLCSASSPICILLCARRINPVV